MNISELVQLGALGLIAVLMIAKDSKRDTFIENLMQKMSESLDRNTAALTDLKDEIRKGNKK